MKVDAADQAQTSIADFYQQYKNLMFKKATEVANDPDYVDDLVQDTLYQLLRREELFLSLSEGCGEVNCCSNFGSFRDVCGDPNFVSRNGENIDLTIPNRHISGCYMVC